MSLVSLHLKVKNCVRKRIFWIIGINWVWQKYRTLRRLLCDGATNPRSFLVIWAPAFCLTCHIRRCNFDVGKKRRIFCAYRIIKSFLLQFQMKYFKLLKLLKSIGCLISLCKWREKTNISPITGHRLAVLNVWKNYPLHTNISWHWKIDLGMSVPFI